MPRTVATNQDSKSTKQILQDATNAYQELAKQSCGPHTAGLAKRIRPAMPAWGQEEPILRLFESHMGGSEVLEASINP